MRAFIQNAHLVQPLHKICNFFRKTRSTIASLSFLIAPKVANREQADGPANLSPSVKQNENDQNYKNVSTPVVGKKSNGKSQMNSMSIHSRIAQTVSVSKPSTTCREIIRLTAVR